METAMADTEFPRTEPAQTTKFMSGRSQSPFRPKYIAETSTALVHLSASLHGSEHLCLATKQKHAEFS
jgi:hypothetical protein